MPLEEINQNQKNIIERIVKELNEPFKEKLGREPFELQNNDGDYLFKISFPDLGVSFTTDPVTPKKEN